MASPKKKPARKKTTSRRKTAARRMSAATRKARSKAKSGRKPAAKPRRSKAAPSKSTPKKAPPAPIQTGLSADRKMEIVGVLFIVVGVLTVLSLASGGNAWTTTLRGVMGWGVIVFALGLILVGLWFILRDFERVPKLAVERLVGLALLFLLILAALHVAVSPPGWEAARAVAAQGIGGGSLGAALMVLLESGLGTLGMFVAFFALAVVGLAMTLDVSVIDLFRWVPPLILRAQDYWDERRAAAARKDRPLVVTLPDAGVPPPPETPPAPIDPAQALPAQAAAPHGAVPDQGVRITPGRSATLSATIPAPREWALPQVGELLDEGADVDFSEDYDKQRAELIEETLASFGAPAKVVEISRGPTITQFGVEPDFIETRSGRTRVRVNKIAALADDLSLALAASRIRIQAPVPGKGYVGIEVPNEKIALVALRDVIESEAFNRLRAPLRFALGQDVAGNAVAADLAGMPHLLVAGATGSGKSVCVNGIITCLLIHNTPAQMRMIMIDPKRVELTGYNGIPHLLAPVVTDIERIVGVLQWVTREMDSRYQKFADSGARNIADYNQRMAALGQPPLPFLVLVIDELADLMMVAPDQTERLITRMAQLARATGIHLLISTQRPSVDVVTGLIKANFPARISFAVASGTDSRVIIDQPGAERLLGRGDMLFQAPDAPAPVRLQGVFVSDAEILRVVQYWRTFAGTTTMAPVATGAAPDGPPQGVPLKQMEIWQQMEAMEEDSELDPLYAEAVELVRRKGKASISMLQRQLRIGYTRSARLIEIMEAQGIVGPAADGPVPREVLDMGED